MSLDVPPGLTELLQEFAVCVLRERPSDLVSFAANYFNRLNDNKTRNTVQKNEAVRFTSSDTKAVGEDEPMLTESDEEVEPPPVAVRLRRKSVSAEGYDPEADEDDGERNIVYPKSDEQRRRLRDAVKHTLLFRSLDQEQMQVVLDAMFEKTVENGDHVIKQGDDGDNFYVIDKGRFDIFVDVDGQPRLVGRYRNEGFFGELALMYNMPRAATIVASSPGSLWALDRVTFRRIVLKAAFLKRKAYEGLLESVPMLKSLDAYERMNVADALQSKVFEDGELIIKQGDVADCMYFVEEGRVRIVMRGKPEANHLTGEEEVEVNIIEKGGYFGELALVTHKPRAASAYAMGRVKCAVLDVQAFERLMGPCMDIMKRNIDVYEEQLAAIFGQKVNMDDLR